MFYERGWSEIYEAAGRSQIYQTKLNITFVYLPSESVTMWESLIDCVSRFMCFSFLICSTPPAGSRAE